MLNALAALLAFWLGLQSTGFTYTPKDNLGQTVDTGAFTFTVESAEAIDGYAGLAPGPGHRLADVVITTANTSATALTLHDWFYPIWWGKTQFDWQYCFVYRTEEMAPLVYYLAPGESVTFHYIYEIPEGAINPHIAYIETQTNTNARGEAQQVETARYTAFFPLPDEPE